MLPETNDIIQLWPTIKCVFAVAHSKDEYNRQVSFLDSLLDEAGGNEDHPLASLIETIGSLIEIYETGNLPEFEATPSETLRYLMTEHGIKQSQLPEIGSQGVVSEILNGKRKLNTRQVKALGDRFGVSPIVFL